MCWEQNYYWKLDRQRVAVLSRLAEGKLIFLLLHSDVAACLKMNHVTQPQGDSLANQKRIESLFLAVILFEQTQDY